MKKFWMVHGYFGEHPKRYFKKQEAIDAAKEIHKDTLKHHVWVLETILVIVPPPPSTEMQELE